MAPAGWKPSKYRLIEPTLAEDLVKHYPGERPHQCLLPVTVLPDTERSWHCYAVVLRGAFRSQAPFFQPCHADSQENSLPASYA